MHVTIKPSKAKGSICAPPSKSMAHRLLICAGLSKGESRVRGLSFSEDVLATLDCLEALSASYTLDGNTVAIMGTNPSLYDGSTVLNCRECGSTLRFMIPLCMTGKSKVSLTGSSTLMERPLAVYEDMASKQGLRYQLNDGILSVQGPLKAGKYEIPGSISSQFVSGLLFSLPLLCGDSTLKLIPPVESRPYIDMTIDALSQFGVEIDRMDENTYFIKGSQVYTSSDASVEGDYSNAAFLEALNLTEGDVKITGLNPRSYQGDKVYIEYYQRLKRGFCTLDISDCPDLGPVLFAVAALFDGAVFTGTKRLRWKESDRASAMAQELKKCGINIIVDDNTVTVESGDLKAPTEVISGHNDHRIVMAMSIILTKIGGTIDGAEAVRKSYPDFFEKLKSLGVEVIISGMDK